MKMLKIFALIRACVTDPQISKTIEFNSTLEPKDLYDEVTAFVNRILNEIENILLDILEMNGKIDHAISVDFFSSENVHLPLMPRYYEEVRINGSAKTNGDISAIIVFFRSELTETFSYALLNTNEFRSLRLAKPKKQATPKSL